MANLSASTIVIGIGNPDRGDDRAGVEAVRRLRPKLTAGVGAIECGGDLSAMIELLAGAAAVVLIDACESGAPAGTVRRMDIGQSSMSVAKFGLSSHGLDLSEILELARALEQLPARCIVYAIEGANFTAGACLSPAVDRAIDDVVRAVQEDVARPPD